MREKLLKRLEQKGWGLYMSSHEILGLLDEEYDEFRDAVKDNDREGCVKELMDIAVGAIFGIISLRDGRMDWPK